MHGIGENNCENMKNNLQNVDVKTIPQFCHNNVMLTVIKLSTLDLIGCQKRGYLFQNPDKMTRFRFGVTL